MCFRKLGLVFIFLLVQIIILQGRDPFFLDEEKTKPSCVKKEEVDDDLKLVGMIKSGEKFGGIIHINSKSYVAFIGDNVAGYVVRSINEKQLVLNKGDQVIRLSCK